MRASGRRPTCESASSVPEPPEHESTIGLQTEIPSNDPDLAAALAAALRGDEEGFRQLFRATQPGLLRYLRVLVGADAEDVASDAWLQIARDLRSFSGDLRGFRAWTATVARHRAIDHARRYRRHPVVPIPAELFCDLPAADDTAASALETLSTDQAIALISGLPREQAEAIMLRVVIGLDADTSGRILGRRAGAVRTAAHRGLRRLEHDLDQLASRPDRRDPTGR